MAAASMATGSVGQNVSTYFNSGSHIHKTYVGEKFPKPLIKQFTSGPTPRLNISQKESKELALKKKLQVFLGDLQKFGTTHGFKHFSCYLRGKEELVISIRNTLPTTPSCGPSRKQSLRHTDSLSSACLPYDTRALTLSHNTQVGLSGLREKGIGLPPASPSEQETSTQQESDITKFLIAGYARYSCPYVWVRSNHDRLMRLSQNSDQEKDCPLRLKSTGRWHEGDVYVFEVIAELVKLSTYPPPRNPFEVDLGYFQNLTQPSQLLASSAMLNFLDKQIMVMSDSKPYSSKVFDDLQKVARLHFSSLQDLIQVGKAPVAQQLQQEKQTPKSSYHQQGTRSWTAQRQLSYPSTPSSTPTTSPHLPSSPSPPSVVPTDPINANSVFFGQGPRGVFPGGFERMPAPTMF